MLRTLFVSALLVLALTACGKKEEVAPAASTPAPAAAPADAAQPADAGPASKS